MHSINNTELSSLEGTRGQFNGSRAIIKLGIVMCTRIITWWSNKREEPIPNWHSVSKRKPSSIGWLSSRVREGKSTVYEACGFGFGLQRQLAALGIKCYVVCPQKLD
jgi:hypothetical protein